LTELFRAYWACELDPVSLEDVAPLVDSVNAKAEAFVAWSEANGASVAATIADELRERGLFNAPGFLVEDEVFFGRQHLPMIRWILDGRTGPGPI
jgi:2-hydroxychromene-2-carboxylate isomerase